MSNTVKRVVTGTVGAPVVLGLAYVGGWAFAALVAGIGLLGQRELYRMARQRGARPHTVSGLGLGALVVASIWHPGLWPVAGGAFLIFVIVASFLLPQERFLFSFAVTVLGIVYPTGMLGSLVWLREVRSALVDDTAAFWLVALTLLMVWASDVAAYFAGRMWGQRRLAPDISSNKTWAGAGGAIAAAGIVGIGLRLVWIDGISWGHLVALVVIAGGIGQLGDLLESRIKRSTNTDDSSALLPGHGGMLDRFDAMAVVAPLVVLYLDHVAHLF